MNKLMLGSKIIHALLKTKIRVVSVSAITSVLLAGVAIAAIGPVEPDMNNTGSPLSGLKNKIVDSVLSVADTSPTPSPSSSTTPTPTPAPTEISPSTTSTPQQATKSTPATSSAAKPTTSAPSASVAKMSDSEILNRIRSTPQGIWAVGGSSDQASVTASRAASAGTLTSLVVYNIPGRDCGSYSAGGAGSPDAYNEWIGGIARGIAGRPTRVILEPDALGQECRDVARSEMLSQAVTTLTNAGARVYIDASSWVAAGSMAARLNESGIGGAAGFSLNVSNFETTSKMVAYGTQVSAATGGKHFIVDTSRNGAGSNGEWCNPAGRAIGSYPTLATGNTLVDGYLWIKAPGESDGKCSGGPSAGTWWPLYALGLGRTAGW